MFEILAGVKFKVTGLQLAALDLSLTLILILMYASLIFPLFSDIQHEDGRICS